MKLINLSALILTLYLHKIKKNEIIILKKISFLLKLK